MAHWAWPWPQKECGECRCTKKVWRSTYSRTGAFWLPPVLVTTDYNTACEGGRSWYLTGPCTAEYIQYTRCDDNSAPPTPTIAAPDCPAVSIYQPCPTCFLLPESASVTLPSSWGVKVNTALSPCSAAGGPIGGLTGKNAPCLSSPLFCDVCPHIPPLTFVHDFTIIDPGGGCSVNSTVPGCGAIPGTLCGIGNAVSYHATYPCCFTTIGGSGVYNLQFAVCSKIMIDSSTSPCRILLQISNIWEVACHGNLGSHSGIVYHSLLYRSSTVSSVIGSTVSVAKISECTSLDGVSYGDAVKCTGAPASLNIVFAA